MDLIHGLLVDDTPDELPSYLNALVSRFASKGTTLQLDVALNAAEALKHLASRAQFDIVLLDIVGVRYEEFLRDLSASWPYLPVVMFSRQAVADEIVKCIDLGARSFIFKLDLGLDIPKLSRQDEWQDEERWRRIVEKIEKLVRDYRPIRRVLESPLEHGVLRKWGGKDSIIRDQIAFLQFVASHPGLSDVFPKVLNDWDEGGEFFYEMPLFRMKSLRNLVFTEDDQEVCLDLSTSVLKLVLDVAFNALPSLRTAPSVPSGFVDELYFRRFQRRSEESSRIIGQLRASESSPAIEAYSRLLDAEGVEIDGRFLRSPAALIGELQGDRRLVQSLRPPRLCLIHGDLHFDNILVDDRLPRMLRIRLVDPRGLATPGYPPGTGDVAYDLGKLLHSAHGLYDFIHAGYLKAQVSSFRYHERRVALPALVRMDWALLPMRGGGSRAVMSAHRQVVPPWTWSVFMRLEGALRSWIAEQGYQEADPHLWLRASLLEALHFCTMGPFHIEDDIERALTIQIRGIELLNEFVEHYRSGAFAVGA